MPDTQRECAGVCMCVELETGMSVEVDQKGGPQLGLNFRPNALQ